MAGLEFRDLRADEIDVRVSQINERGLSLLLYKDARCDMNILDETVGAFNWQRMHSRDNANCTVSIYDDAKGIWVSKEDTGTESNTEAAKGLASDSFKRACFNWGIGRELYTAPFIWVKSNQCEITTKNGKWVCYDKFAVDSITIENKKIVALAIKNTTQGVIVFTMGKTTAKAAQSSKAKKTEAKTPPPPDAGTTVEPNSGEPEVLPFEIVSETSRDQFRNYVSTKKLTVPQINQILVYCSIKDSSTDAEWRNALDYAQALYGGI